MNESYSQHGFGKKPADGFIALLFCYFASVPAEGLKFS